MFENFLTMFGLGLRFEKIRIRSALQNMLVRSCFVTNLRIISPGLDENCWRCECIFSTLWASVAIHVVT